MTPPSNSRFQGIPAFYLACLMPWEIASLGFDKKEAIFRISGGGLQFRSTIAGGIISIPNELITNFASIPRFFWRILPPDDPCIAAGSVVHDFLYGEKGKIKVWDGDELVDVRLTRDQCDRILAYEAMPELGAPKWKQDVVYYSLRWFGDRW